MNDFAPTNTIYNLQNDTTPATAPNTPHPKQKQDMSYFGAMKRKFQDDNIIWYQKPEQIQKYAKERIFREMVRGNIDYAENGHYFLDLKFLDNLIQAAQDELINNTVIRDSLRYYNYCFPGQQPVQNQLARYESLVYIMSVIHTKLNEVKYIGNIGPLTQIQYVMKSYGNLL